MARRKGWRPSFPGQVCSLGYLLIEWAEAYLPSPRDEDAPFDFTDEQARHVVAMYQLDPVTGARLYRRVHEEQPKGWGKSPFAGAVALMEFAGPVCFAGWDADGQPVGVGYGSRGRPSPWVQVAAVSEAQTANTWVGMYGLLMSRRGGVADALGIDPGITLLRRRDMADAVMERVTASAGTREGQPITMAVMDEPQLWMTANRGIDLARTIFRNLTKMNGWAMLTGNAPLLGSGSVAELYGRPGRGVLHLSNRPYDQHMTRDAPKPTDDRAVLLPMLRKVYGDAAAGKRGGWVDLQRVLEDALDGDQPWTDTKRFFFNLPSSGDQEDAWMASDLWESCAGDPVFDAAVPVYACVRVAHDNRSVAVAAAQAKAGAVSLRVRMFVAAAGDYVDVDRVERHLLSLHRRYPARVMTDVQFRADGRSHKRKRPGPEVLHHTAFFEPSRQRLVRHRVVMVDWPSSTERLAPAAAALMQQVTAGTLVHDGASDLAQQMGRLVAVERPKGWAVESRSEETIVGAQAAMLAVHRALQQTDRRRTR